MAVQQMDLLTRAQFGMLNINKKLKWKSIASLLGCPYIKIIAEMSTKIKRKDRNEPREAGEQLGIAQPTSHLSSKTASVLHAASPAACTKSEPEPWLVG